MDDASRRERFGLAPFAATGCLARLRSIVPVVGTRRLLPAALLGQDDGAAVHLPLVQRVVGLIYLVESEVLDVRTNAPALGQCDDLGEIDE